MSPSYEVTLYSIGNRKDQILNYVRTMPEFAFEEVESLLNRLPIVIKRTHHHFEAKLIKEALDSFGADVRIIEVSEGPVSGYNRGPGGLKFSKPSPDRVSPIEGDDFASSEDSSHGYTDYYTTANPIKPASIGCLGIVVTGFLAVCSLLYLFLFSV